MCLALQARGEKIEPCEEKEGMTGRHEENKKEKNMKNMKEAFVAKMETQLEQWKKKIDEMEAEARTKEAEADAEKADAELKKQLYEKVEGLKQTYEDTKNRLQELRRSGDASWEKLKMDVEKARDDLGRGIVRPFQVQVRGACCRAKVPCAPSSSNLVIQSLLNTSADNLQIQISRVA
jgi:exonuclease VII large subunit